MADEPQQHQALYRRYRPQTPSGLIGQDHVVRGLTGAIREDKLHHAFLFISYNMSAFKEYVKKEEEKKGAPE